jgi:hypothetical protein
MKLIAASISLVAAAVLVIGILWYHESQKPPCRQSGFHFANSRC